MTAEGCVVTVVGGVGGCGLPQHCGSTLDAVA